MFKWPLGKNVALFLLVCLFPQVYHKKQRGVGRGVSGKKKFSYLHKKKGILILSPPFFEEKKIKKKKNNNKIKKKK